MKRPRAAPTFYPDASLSDLSMGVSPQALPLPLSLPLPYSTSVMTLPSSSPYCSATYPAEGGADDIVLHSLAKLDAGLGLSGCSSPAPTPCTSSSTKRIEQELDELLSRPRLEAVGAAAWADDVSCVSGSGPSNGACKHAAEETSPMDVVSELQALDGRSSTTVLSPAPAIAKRRQRKRKR